jgi:hypothetical protein
MGSPQAKDVASQIQKGYRAVPISDSDVEAPLRLCVIVRDAPDPVAGMFVLIRDGSEVSIYLGGLVDAGGYIHQWIELWLQNINNLEVTLAAYQEAFSNQLLDERWRKRAALFARLDRSVLISLPAETRHTFPIYFDLAVSGPVRLIDPGSSSPWELCQDDQLLVQHGLPPYSTSLARYLAIRGRSKPPFLPMTTSSPSNEATQDPKQFLGSFVPLNPDGGLMLARKFAPLKYEAYVDLLSGHAWKGVEEGTKVFKLAAVYETLQNAETLQQGGGHLFLGKRGSAGRLVEAFHLKLNLVLQAFQLVRDFIRDEQLPFLNLSAESFRVSLAETSPTLPFLWTAKVSLALPGAAFSLPVENSNARYFVVAGKETASIYRPMTSSLPVHASGAVRIRKILSQNDDTVILEGTISTQERIGIAQTDLLWIRLNLSAGRVDFYANLTEGVAQGEQRFRTLPQKLPEHLGIAIRSAEGVRFPNVPFETLPLRSSPCDLYTLAVLGVRTLLVNEDLSLAAALDELLSLGQHAGAETPGGPGLASRIRAIAASDLRWAASLGPHRLLKAQSITQEEALAYLPEELWWETIALLIQCLPGATPSALCSSLGDAPPLALHAIFEAPIQALEKILVRSRSLLFIDWKYNSEVNSVLQSALQRHLSESGS